MIEQLTEQTRLAQHQRFGASSEKSPQLDLFNEAETLADQAESDPAEETDDKPSTRKKSVGRHPLPPELERKDIVHDLTDNEKQALLKDGGELRCIGEEVTEQLEFTPAKLVVLRHIRKKYVCEQADTKATQLITAPKPKQPIEKSIASPSLLAYIAVSKYADGLPLHRLVNNLFKRMGINLDSTLLAQWMIRCSHLLQPVFNLMQERLLEAPILHMDETRVQVLNEAGKTPQSQSYMWLMRNAIGPPVILFHYSPNRSQDTPNTLLAGYDGVLMVDGYSGYQPVCDAQSLTRLGCWVHARRKFVDAQKAQPKGKTNSKADHAVATIGKLYRIEKDAKNKGLSFDERHALRQQKAKPIIDKLKAWLEKKQPEVLPRSLTGKAMTYLSNQWPRLIRYLDDGRYPIDNNLAEQTVRPFAVGRKNWLFSQTTAGAQASAIIYSLVETAKANDLEPQAYLTQLFTELPNMDSFEQMETLLPWKVSR